MATVVVPRRVGRRAAAAVVGVLAGCSAAAPKPLAHPLVVTAQPFALAQVAMRVGLGRVTVTDRGGVVLTSGAGADPWLDPVAMEAVAGHVADQLSQADPGGRRAYREAATV